MIYDFSHMFICLLFLQWRRGSQISHPPDSLGKPCCRLQPKNVTLFQRTQAPQVSTRESTHSMTVGTNMPYLIVECLGHNCMAASLCLQSTQAGTSHSTMSIGSRKDWNECLQKRLCKFPLGMRMLENLVLQLIQNTQQKQQTRIYFIHER